MQNNDEESVIAKTIEDENQDTLMNLDDPSEKPETVIYSDSKSSSMKTLSQNFDVRGLIKE